MSNELRQRIEQRRATESARQKLEDEEDGILEEVDDIQEKIVALQEELAVKNARIEEIEEQLTTGNITPTKRGYKKAAKTTPVTGKKRMGRPVGSGKKPNITKSGKRMGRPPGSGKKKTTVAATPADEEAEFEITMQVLKQIMPKHDQPGIKVEAIVAKAHELSKGRAKPKDLGYEIVEFLDEATKQGLVVREPDGDRLYNLTAKAFES